MHRRAMGLVPLLVAMVLLTNPARADAEWQLRPFAGITFGVGNTFYDTDLAASKPKLCIGVAGALLGEVVGLEADFGRMDGFYESGRGGLVKSSSVTTLTGNATIGLPRRLTEYTLRPYFAGGGGLMRVRSDNFVNGFDVSENLPTIDVGGGVTGVLPPDVGLNWDVRYFRSVRRAETSSSIGPGQLSFWRANMALAIRY
jgi:hypothetical protein